MNRIIVITDGNGDHRPFLDLLSGLFPEVEIQLIQTYPETFEGCLEPPSKGMEKRLPGSVDPRHL